MKKKLNNLMTFLKKNYFIIFKIKNCQKSFKLNFQVNHKSAAHKRAKEFENKRGRKCQFCEKSFSESSKYFKHANASHPDEVIEFDSVD